MTETDDDETAAIINAALARANEPEISQEEIHRARRERVVAWAVFGVLFVASWGLGIFDDPANPLTVVAWIGCAGGMLIALLKAGVFHSMFRK